MDAKTYTFTDKELTDIENDIDSLFGLFIGTCTLLPNGTSIAEKGSEIVERIHLTLAKEWSNKDQIMEL